MTSPAAPPTVADPVPGARAVLWAVVPLLVGVGMLTGASGLQASLVALRGTAEGFRAAETGLIASAYFAGFLVGTRLAPEWIRRVGHVRAFAAFTAIMSTLVLLHVLAINVPVWVIARFLSGVCLSGLVVIIESWLTREAPREARGRVLSTYMMVNLGGYTVGQVLLPVFDISGFELFALVSVLLSLASVPVILSTRSRPVVTTTTALPIRVFVKRAPAGAVASAMSGFTWGAIAGWSAVVAVQVGLDGIGITAFVSSFLVGHLLVEPVVGVVSDRTDRRVVVTALSTGAVATCVLAVLLIGSTTALLLLGLVIGAMTLPLYSLSIALAGDYLDPEEMQGASATLVRVNGIGASLGPLTASVAATSHPAGFYLVVAGGAGVVAVVGMTLLVRGGRLRRPRVPYVRSFARASAEATRIATRNVSRTRRRNGEPRRPRQNGPTRRPRQNGPPRRPRQDR